MLSRFFDKKNTPASDAGDASKVEKGTAVPGIQGSLLDLMEEVPSISPSHKGLKSPHKSLLSAMDMADEKAERDLQNWIAGREQETQRLARLKIEEERYRAEARLQQSPLPSSTKSNASSSQSQLDLLANELAAIRSDYQDALSMKDTNSTTQAELTQPADGRAPQNLPQVQYQVQAPSPFAFDKLIAAVLKSWRWVGLGIIAGSCLAAAIALSLPNKYESVAEILIEPRGLRVLDNSVAPNELNSEATVAYAESQVSIIRSLSVIDPVIKDLKLAADPEFNGQAAPSGLVGQLWDSLISNKSNATNTLELAREYLQENLTVSRVNQTFAINIGVETESPEKSMTVANAIARSYIADESGARSSAAKNASEDLLGRLATLRGLVQVSEEAVEKYKNENDLIVAGGQLVSEAQLSRLNDQLAIAQVQTGEARTRAKQARKADPSDIISGSLPSSLTNSGITQLRSEYAKIQAKASTLAVKLGARHPKRVAAAVELNSIRTSLRREIKRMIASSQIDFKTAKARETDLIAQINQLKMVVSSSRVAMVKLREMEREVVANRKVYEAFLERSREISELENIRSESARLISVAALPLKKKGPNRKLIVAAGGVLGGGLGGLFGLIPFLIGGLRQFAGGAKYDVQPEQFVGDLYPTRETKQQSAIYTQWSPQPISRG
ncbi:MAG: GumC family protein [Rhizobiaceae bacterium]